jgi:hypothetical protein
VIIQHTQDFYAPLNSYGAWIVLPFYGRVWQPAVTVVNSEWRPYFQGGRWIYTVEYEQDEIPDGVRYTARDSDGAGETAGNQDESRQDARDPNGDRADAPERVGLREWASERENPRPWHHGHIAFGRGQRNGFSPPRRRVSDAAAVISIPSWLPILAGII